MNKGDDTTDIMGIYSAKEGLHDGLPTAEANGDRDEEDLAAFGKRPQLKVCSSSPWHLSLKFQNSEHSASFQWSV